MKKLLGFITVLIIVFSSCQVEQKRENTMNVSVDYSYTFQQLVDSANIKEKSKYASPVYLQMPDKEGVKEIKCKIFPFNYNPSSWDVIEAMKKDGFRPANIYELLFFVKKYDFLQRKNPVIGLGTRYRFTDDFRGAPSVHKGYLETNEVFDNALGSQKTHWFDYCLFLGVKI